MVAKGRKVRTRETLVGIETEEKTRRVPNQKRRHLQRRPNSLPNQKDTLVKISTATIRVRAQPDVTDSEPAQSDQTPYGPVLPVQVPANIPDEFYALRQVVLVLGTSALLELAHHIAEQQYDR